MKPNKHKERVSGEGENDRTRNIVEALIPPFDQVAWERRLKVARGQVKLLTELLQDFAEGWPDLVDEIGGKIVLMIQPEVENMSEYDWRLSKRNIQRAYREWCTGCGRRLEE